MSTPALEPSALLGRAADLRARGTPWDDVATKLAVPLEDLRRLACDHARAYDRLECRAKREYRAETMNATVARLRDLLKSQDEGVALSAAANLVRYDLALLRHRAQARADRANRRPRRRRDDLPPAPVRGVTAENARCDTPPSVPQVPAPQGVPAAPGRAEKSGCDSVTVAPPGPPAPRGSTHLVDTIRRQRWLPPGLAPR